MKMPLLAVPAMAPLANSTDSTTVGSFRTITFCSCRLEPADVAPCVKAANSGELVSANLESFCFTWPERLEIAAASMAAGTGISYATSQTLGPPEAATTASVLRPVTCRKPACANAATCALLAASRLPRCVSCQELHSLLGAVIVRRSAPATFCELTPTAATPAPVVVVTFVVTVVTDDVETVEVVVVHVPTHVVEVTVMVVKVAVAVVGHALKPQF